MLARFDMHELSLPGRGFLILICYRKNTDFHGITMVKSQTAVHRSLNKTQPVPNPIAFYLHKSPEIIHKFEVLGNHFVELIAPVFIILPFRKLRIFSSLSVIFFMTVIGSVQIQNFGTNFMDHKLWSIFGAEMNNSNVKQV